MKIIFNKYIPFKGYAAMCIYPLLFVRNDVRLSTTDIQHEKIHAHQQVEVLAVSAALLVPFACVGVLSFWWVLASPTVYYALYGLEYAVRLILYGLDNETAYRNISFEQEAYIMQSDGTYNSKRKPFASLKYLTRRTYMKKK